MLSYMDKTPQLLTVNKRRSKINMCIFPNLLPIPTCIYHLQKVVFSTSGIVFAVHIQPIGISYPPAQNMMKERHFRLWKNLACASIVGPVAHGANTKNTCVLPSRMLSRLLVPTTGKCCERLQARSSLTYTERVKFCSRLLQSNITCSNAARLLFTTSSSDAVSQSPTNPGRDATTANKRNIGLKNNTAKKQVSSTRRPSTQKVDQTYITMVM